MYKLAIFFLILVNVGCAIDNGFSTVDSTSSDDSSTLEETELLSANRKKEGVLETMSGLQYMIINYGDGEKPKKEDTVVINYDAYIIGKLTVFDSTKSRGVFKAKLSHLIKGLQEGIPLMSTGSKFTFFIPAKLAYGKQGIKGLIEPNKLLIYEIELIGIESETR